MRYFSSKPGSSIVSLITFRGILGLATGLVGIFLPIFFYEIFSQNIFYLILFYGLASLAYALVAAPAAILFNRFGWRRALITSIPLGIIFYLWTFLLNKELSVLLVALAIITLTLHRASFWIPYQVDFAKWGDQTDRGKEVGSLYAIRHLVGIVIPVISGFIIARSGFGILFIIAMVIYLISYIPLHKIPETAEHFSLTIKQAWQALFKRSERRTVVSYMASGAEFAIGGLLWPIFVFIILKGDFLTVGFIITLVAAGTVALDLVLGKVIDNSNKHKLIRGGSIIRSLGWIVKIFVSSASHIFVIGAMHNVANILLREPFDTLYYEVTADQGHYIDEYTVIHEMAVHMGRFIMLGISALVLISLPLQWTFILAALAAPLLTLLHHNRPSLNRRFKVQS